MANKWVQSVLSSNNTVNIIRFVKQIHEFALQNIRVTLALYLQNARQISFKTSTIQTRFYLFIYFYGKNACSNIL